MQVRSPYATVAQPVKFSANQRRGSYGGGNSQSPGPQGSGMIGAALKLLIPAAIAIVLGKGACDQINKATDGVNKGLGAPQVQEKKDQKK